DLANGALPIYLSRPFSRTEYILGKATVLGSLIASITLIPALLLFAIQSSLAGWSWFSANFYMSTGILVSCALVMAVMILLGLAMSALVRWRIIAGALVLAVFAAGKGFGAVVNNVMRTSGGYYIDLQHLLSTVAASLLHYVADDDPVPAYAACIALVIFCAFL